MSSDTPCLPRLACQVNKGIRAVRLHDNNLGDDAVRALASAIVTDGLNIEELDLSENKLGAPGVLAMATLLTGPTVRRCCYCCCCGCSSTCRPSGALPLRRVMATLLTASRCAAAAAVAVLVHAGRLCGVSWPPC